MNKCIGSLLVLGLLSGNALADTGADPDYGKAFLGVDLFKGKSTVDIDVANFSDETDVDFKGFRARFGKVMENGFRFQAYFSSEMPDNDDFWDNDIYGLGADVIKPFPVHQSIQPFLKAGAMVGWTELDDTPAVDYVDDQFNFLGLKLGFGALFKVNETVELMSGFDWQYRTWQDIKYIGGGQTITQETSDTSTSIYVGVNFFL